MHEESTGFPFQKSIDEVGVKIDIRHWSSLFCKYSLNVVLREINDWGISPLVCATSEQYLSQTSDSWSIWFLEAAYPSSWTKKIIARSIVSHSLFVFCVSYLNALRHLLWYFPSAAIKSLTPVFCFVQNFFLRTTRVRIFIFFCHAKREFFFLQNLTLGYMTKTLNQIIFFSSTKIRIFFSATLGIRIFFLETPPPRS